jgi:glycine/D-amino acid oxidase-like deaminating enzyme
LQRRLALKALLGFTGTVLLPASLRAASPARRPHVAVIGAGIVGASIAFHLARSGARVTILDRTGPAAGATRNSFAWIDPWTLDLHYQQLRLRSIAAYHRLDRPLGLGVIWGGYIDWAESAADAKDVEDLIAAMAHTPFPVTRIDHDAFRRLSPAIEPGPIRSAFHSRIDGHVDPVEATQRFIAAAARYGARLEAPAAVRDFEMAGDRITGVVTAAGPVEVDHVVMAAGVDTPALLARLGESLRLKHAPGILAHSVPQPIVTRLVYDGPGGLEFQQRGDGSIVGTDSEQVPDLPQHHEIREHAMDFPSAALRQQHGDRILGKLARYLPAARGAGLSHLTLGFRVLPTDELPIVGALPSIPNAHVVATHSGVTLAPLLGELVAGEILEGRLDPVLAPYRPDRMLRPTIA